MANGDSGPVPIMPEGTWANIKDLAHNGEGGWNINSVAHVLYNVRDGYRGATQWLLEVDGEGPTDVFRCPVSAADWATIKGGIFIPAENRIDVGENSYRLEFCNDGGSSTAKVISV